MTNIQEEHNLRESELLDATKVCKELTKVAGSQGFAPDKNVSDEVTMQTDYEINIKQNRTALKK